VEIVEVTLHVGYGTFQPVRVERVEDHKVEPETYSVSEEAARSINRAIEEKRRVIAVGTTTTRALESAGRLGSVAGSEGLASPQLLNPGTATTDLFIHPGFDFRVIGGLVTNFHLPQSSLLMLVAAFGGRELILDAYRYAVARGYHFYSYGDGMLIL
jgi:S-adenosylmethionine:tRNA ribosyltransferase-isomerase